MPLVQCTTAAEVFANAKRVRANVKAWAPRPKYEPAPITATPPNPPKRPPPIKYTTTAEPEAEIVVLHSVTRIIEAVAAYYKIKPIEILSARRTMNITLPRQIAAYLAKTLTTKSLPEIGRRMGGKDHTTVLHSVTKITRLRQINPVIDAEILALELELNPRAFATDPNQIALPFAGESVG